MDNHASDPDKLELLREQGTLNKTPEQVRDPLFLEESFFDPNDLLQVKYEMLRRVFEEGESITRAAAAFGFSRISYYRIQAAFQKRGLFALFSRKPGPKKPHKLTPELLAFIEDIHRQDESIRPVDLAAQVAQRYGCQLHPRTIERALKRKKNP